MADEKPWPEFCCSYQFEGQPYGFTVPAKDFDEARRRLRAIGMTGWVDGELYERIPATMGAGLYVRAKTFFLNLIGA